MGTNSNTIGNVAFGNSHFEPIQFSETNTQNQILASNLQNQSNTNSISSFQRMLSACSGALMTTLLVTPFDVVKTRMQSGSSSLHGSVHLPQKNRLLPNQIATRSFSVEQCCRENIFSLEKHSSCRLQPTVAFDGVCPLEVAPSTSFQNSSTRIFLSGTVPGNKISGTLDGIVKILRYEGPVGLYRGLSPTLVMSVPSTVIYYVGYEKIRDQLLSSLQGFGMEFYAPLTVVAISASIISPLELVRTRMQAGGDDKNLKGAIEGIRKMVKLTGVRSLWRGLEPTLWRDVPFS
ncbi:hypothetical protein HK096_006134, partial [Nowakowskiella sp. JEL0078]